MYKKLLLGLVLIITSCKGVSQEKEMAMEGNSKQEEFEITKTDAEWRNELDAMEYFILREAGTERAFSSELLKNNKKGIYVCAACGTELFKSENKFDSGTGWPSFDQEIKGNVAYDVDYKIGYKRTEEHCATCGGHLGHVFNDGPSDTTGERHCINGAALNFVARN
ncbi:peptide-methionine (R)-S-oxide reductase MsrB [Cellulophaga baltica]|uniref:peptide-methionine (R)-S-oxide reductase MsrB n=1 Tax=Cellulophaga TaxID=104264 RepID=UPI001C07E882|nr:MULTISPECIES: peptide-methionine (R)-S-oxide reductase MsrB [Cellulophaga]MBU2994890.1 peptide-methionine (R)-S-oxide reductase MsrB [Cellulophaga baltica]MDO6766284.1 peptide-methionine (R)-S-oxide reductase MsrB [Cellulophaga sp. 1_MG-2023]